MARESEIMKQIYRKHIRLFRFINDAWIFTDLLRSELEARATELGDSRRKSRRRYAVPRLGKQVVSKRRNEEIRQIYVAQYERGIYETNIVSLVSRSEAFLQDAMAIVACEYPQKLSIISKNTSIPLDLFLQHEDRDDVIRRFVASNA
ncbi:MAG: hypothetical protein V7704_05855 [Aurantimonas endophytica]|uniref:hypothetical protein n=1 Tax=Aurantimonas endophytica TaxID=1522175 RepID=UPI00300288B0